MKKILFVIVIMVASAAFAKKKETLAEVSFKSKESNHRYVLLKEGKKPVFKLVFYENKNKPRTKVVSESEANSIRSETTRIVWDSLYRRSANVKKCTTYASIVSGPDKADVCLEDTKLTGRTYGLLNSLRAKF